MPELDLLRSFNDEAPLPGADALARGRMRLLDAIEREPRRERRLAFRARLGYTLAVPVAAVSVAVAMAVLGGPARQVGGTPPHMALAAAILHRGAAAVEAQPSVRPAPDQWIYSASVDVQAGQPPQTSAQWVRFNGSEEAYMQGGQLVIHRKPTATASAGTPIGNYLQDATPMSAYDALASLPRNPKALLAAVDVATGPGFEAAGLFGTARAHDSAEAEFQFLAQLLWNAAAAAPATAEAAVFRALATIPGVTIQQQVTDAAGEPALAVSGDGGELQLLLDPTTYRTLGMRTVSTGTGPQMPTTVGAGTRAAPSPAGTVLDSLAWSDVKLVGQPGRR